MKKTYKQWLAEDYLFCLLVNPKVDMMMVGSYRCNLKAHAGEVMLIAVSAEDFLRKDTRLLILMGVPLHSWIRIYLRNSFLLGI